MPDPDPPRWLNKIDIGTIAALRLEDGECMTAEILAFAALAAHLNLPIRGTSKATTIAVVAHLLARAHREFGSGPALGGI